MEIVQTQDTGTLQYEIYFTDDESECVVLERSTDGRGLIAHGERIGNALMEAVIATGSVHGRFLGELSPELKANLAGGRVQPFMLYRSM